MNERNMSGVRIADRYLLEKRLGGGGFYECYEATDTKNGKKFAVKLLNEGLFKNPRTAEKTMDIIKSDLRISSAVKHPNVVDIIDFGAITPNNLADGMYAVIELLTGSPLKTILREQKQLPWKDAKPIFLDVCEGLYAFHKAGFIYGEISPNKIMRHDSKTKILHSSMSQEIFSTKEEDGFFLGVPAYACPERASGSRHLDHRSDIYAFGVTMYETLTGSVPLKGKTPLETLTMVRTVVPELPSQRRPDLSIPADLDQIVIRALEKKLDSRYQSIMDMKHDIEQV